MRAFQAQDGGSIPPTRSNPQPNPSPAWGDLGMSGAVCLVDFRNCKS